MNTILPIRPIDLIPTGIVQPKPGYTQFLAGIRHARAEVRDARVNLDLPLTAMPLVDPVVPAQVHAKLALDAIDGALAAKHVPSGAVTAVRNARNDVLSGYNTLHYRLNGPVDVSFVRKHFDAAVNWLTVAENIVA